MINKSLKYIGVLLLAYTLNACNEQRMSSSSETTTPVWLSEVGKRDIRELTTTTGTAKAAKTVEVKSETNGKYELMINPKTKRPYKLGDIVEEGAVIIKLNNKEHENTVSLPTKKMQVDIAKKEWEGQKAVFEKGGATEKDVLNAESSYIQAQSALESAYTDLAKLTIKAPFKGAIVSLPYFTPNVEIASGETMVGLQPDVHGNRFAGKHDRQGESRSESVGYQLQYQIRYPVRSCNAIIPGHQRGYPHIHRIHHDQQSGIEITSRHVRERGDYYFAKRFGYCHTERHC